jgi:uncharacterized protein (TIGR04255 family)
MPKSSQRYANPPLREAVCEFRFQQGHEPWNLSFPGLIYNELREEFPKRIQPTPPRQGFSISLGFSPGWTGGPGPAPEHQSLTFWREQSNDGAITVAPNQINISHYRPYPSWDAFLDIIRQAYNSYVNVAKPQGIQRVGLRYTNEIQFPTDSLTLSEYFTYHPNFGPELPQINLNVKMSSDFPFNNYRDLARLQLATITGVEGSSIAVSLDVDYFLLIPNAVPLKETEGWLNQAHGHISDIFEGSITDKTRTLLNTKEGQ